MNWWGRLVKKDRAEAELEKELRFHLDRQIADYRSAGLSEEEAQRKARLDFGGVEQISEDCREARGTRWIESALQDARLALRTLRKSLGFTITAVGILALGIGAITAIFTLLDALRLRSLPVPDPQKLALIQIEGGNRGFGISGSSRELSYTVWEQIRDHQRGFSGVFAWARNSAELGTAANHRSLKSLWVSGGIFSTLGLVPTAGRLFRPQDDQRGCGIPGAVISYGFWQSEFDGSDSAVGTKLLIKDHPTEVIGVTPPGFSGLEPGENFDIALPICSIEGYSSSAQALRRTDFSFLTVMGRLRPGWTLARAAGQLASISPAIFQATVPTGYEASSRISYRKFRLSAYPAAHGVNDTDTTSLWLLLGITGLVLLIACANLANLMLVRAATRERETAVRLALGASRRRIIQQLLTESLLLCIAGAVLGAGLTHVLSRLILVLLTTQDYTPYLDLHPDWRILIFTASMAILTCLLFGLMPAFRGSRANPGEVVKIGSRGISGGRQRSSFQNALVVCQIAISLVLLVGALLFVRSFWNLMTLNPGFRENGIVIASLDLSHLPLPPGERSEQALRNLLEQVRSLPQVQSAATSTHVPLDGSSWTLGFDLPGLEGSSKFTWVSPGFFNTLGIPLLAGRDFNDRDSATSQHVAVVNQTFVRRFLGSADPLGRILRTRAEPNYPATVYEIVGIVKDAKYARLREEIPPEVFGPARQFSDVRRSGAIFIHSSFPPASVIAAVRQKLNAISPAILADFSVFTTQIADSLVLERLMALLSGFFGGLAALLSAVGLYGVISYIVTARRDEIGIRLALGAKARDITGAILKRTLVLLFIGTAAGLALAATAAITARSLLFGIRPTDPVTFLAASAFLLAITLVASFFPARRAARLDPMTALRNE